MGYTCGDRLRVGWRDGFTFHHIHRGVSLSTISGRGTRRAEDAQGTPTQTHVSPSILVYEGYRTGYVGLLQGPTEGVFLMSEVLL